MVVLSPCGLHMLRLRESFPAQNLSQPLYLPHANDLFPARTTSVTTSEVQPFDGSGQGGPVAVVVGGGAAGFFAAIRAKELSPNLDVTVLEKSLPLAKVRVSGGGRCNVTTGLHTEPLALAGQYPRGFRELRGTFFRTHGPADTAAWFERRGVPLKTEDDGRMFPRSDSSASIVNCLLREAERVGVRLRTGSRVDRAQTRKGGGFELWSPGAQSPLSADFLLLATGSAPQGHRMAASLGHSIVDPRPSLFTFKIPDPHLTALAGVSIPWVEGTLEMPNLKRREPRLVQAGPLLVTHWGLSGPMILRLSAWAARHLFDTSYKASLSLDFAPSMNAEDTWQLLVDHRENSQRRMVGSGAPPILQIPRRFWGYLLQRQELDPELLWRDMPKKSLRQLAASLKRLPFDVHGKGEFKDEFVTAGGVPLGEVNLATMESRKCPSLFFAGEVLDVDGITGGFNFQNAWSGGFLAGTSIAAHANARLLN